MEVFTSEDLCDEVEEAIKRILNQLLQCALLLEEELLEGGQFANDATKIFTVFFNQERRTEEVWNSKQAKETYDSSNQFSGTFCLEHGCKINDIASLFGCSRWTIEHRLWEVGVSVRKSYSQISDGALCRIVHGIIAHNPRVGEKRVDGYLRTQRIVVQRQRIIDPWHSVDPLASQRRLRRALNHREYHVEHPNALWHVDGYHKLIL